ncbi:MAG: PQQ-binding-like beta-propeller repeat protein [Pirellulales bacterium]
MPRRTMVLSLLVVSMLAAGLVSLAADEQPATWPQMLGPDRNGVSHETGLIDRFSGDGPTVVWRVPGGVGMSGIALDGQRAITLVEREGQQMVLALDAANGKTLWQSPVADAYQNGMGNGPRATPTITGQHVLAYTGEGILAALQLEDGKLLWQHDCVGELGGTIADYGMACSPLAAGDLAIVTTGAPGAAIVAYQIKTGKLAWKAGNDRAGYSSPALLKVGGQQQVVAVTGQSTMGLAPATGEILWRHEFETDFDCNIATPLAVGEDVFISAGENHGSALLQLSRGGKSFKVKEAWSSLGPKSVMRNEWQTSILLDGHLYGMDNVGGAGPITHLNCIEAKSGKLKWRQQRFGKGNLIAADGKLYIATFDGDLAIVRASPKGFEELDRAPVLGSTRQAPSLLNGKLYLRDASEIVCIDIKQPK